MKKHTFKRIKNSTLILVFFVFVFCAILISLVVKICILITQSRFDGVHQFIVDAKDRKGNEEIIAFNPSVHVIGALDVLHAGSSNVMQSLQIPVDAQFTASSISSDIPSLLFSAIFHCQRFACIHMNTIDAIRLYTFARSVRPNAIASETVSFPVAATVANSTITQVMTDDKLYQEALSIAIVNASGEPGLGNEFGKLLTNIGGNVISITTGNLQQQTTMQSTAEETSYTVQRLEQILHLTAHHVQNAGIADIVMTIGKQHAPL